MDVRMMTQAIAAEGLTLSPRSLEKMRTTGRGPKYIKVGRRVLYDPRDVAAWLESHKVSNTAEAGGR